MKIKTVTPRGFNSPPKLALFELCNRNVLIVANGTGNTTRLALIKELGQR